MSSEDKIDVLKASRAKGFKNYLYYIATDDPAINVQRVHNRVKTGGHPVPEEKIRQRYDRSLDLLLKAIKLADRAFIFDNSGTQDIWLAEVTPNGDIQLKKRTCPTGSIEVLLRTVAFLLDNIAQARWHYFSSRI